MTASLARRQASTEEVKRAARHGKTEALDPDEIVVLRIERIVPQPGMRERRGH